ncbi:hypothetical protein SR914_22600 [Comamonas testosteroni]|jgi:hypothetical protein|uniref:Uncharacterized protein n=2 Tax=Comamonas testosteroni TaxID=285 RepID=B7WWR5_COMTK|nr:MULTISPECIES: hypothetical protein [Comamonas]AIJ46582.1 hypothetical protein O987_12330 [Comamonas testosteroni TK102]EED67799.1 hypothetical protein CtesDRAFT_PD2745 [Comamonas testosteroni KF-1]MPS89039.1 hypothetical protein [Comamonas sp.]TYK67489.1 hypothetical protein FSY59_27235 [Comamonas sp. Z3]WQG65924.1 hypothetical protein SR914_22600 [Comamonas testosteroni]
MSQEINKFVAQAIIENALFFEFSGEKIIDPDAAIQALEQMAATLQMADTETKASLCLHFKNIAMQYSGEKADFVASLDDALGLFDA